MENYPETNACKQEILLCTLKVIISFRTLMLSKYIERCMNWIRICLNFNVFFYFNIIDLSNFFCNCFLTLFIFFLCFKVIFLMRFL